MIRGPLFRLVSVASAALTAFCAAAFAVALVITELIAAPIVAPVAYLARAQPRSIFETRRAGLA